MTLRIVDHVQWGRLPATRFPPSTRPRSSGTFPASLIRDGYLDSAATAQVPEAVPNALRRFEVEIRANVCTKRSCAILTRRPVWRLVASKTNCGLSGLANSKGAILDMLDEANPVVYVGGRRRYRLHQFLTEQVGLPALRQHLWQTIGIGPASRDKMEFERGFYRAFPEAIPKQNPDQFDFLDQLK